MKRNAASIHHGISMKKGFLMILITTLCSVWIISCTDLATTSTLSQSEWSALLSPYADTDYDIILVAGQSNAVGVGHGDGERYLEDERVAMLNEDHSITTAAERVVGDDTWNNFSLFFAKAYVEAGLLEEGRTLLILNMAVGGTGFKDHRWNPGEDLYERMITTALAVLSLHAENRIVAVLWHQGETDAILDSTYREYDDHLHAMITSLRTDLALDGIPFIAGDFVPVWKEEAKTQYPIDEVISAARQVLADLPHCGFVETDGLTSNINDSIHFSRAANIELGQRYFDLYLTLIDG
ncbi:MAG: sialate O-acetylesterase [Bacillota bacterium]|nr:sialate O-acetylesterase [Bacillota bacterium]